MPRCIARLLLSLVVALLTCISDSQIARAAPPPEVEVLVRFKNAPGPNERALIRGQGGTVDHTFSLVPAVAARIPPAAVAALQKNPNVAAVEPDVTLQINDVELDRVWGVTRIGAGLVHLEGNKGAGVKVAVLDTGIDYRHPDLDANVVGGWDFVNNDADPMDDHSHGTHIAGTIAAEDNDWGVVGVAPEVSLYAVKVMGATGSGSSSNIIKGIEWCVQNGIHVTNSSFGIGFNPGSTFQAAYDKATAAGLVMIAAAGNSGTSAGDTQSVTYPAAYTSVIAVGATTSSNTRASWSSTGSQLELAAPGSSIYSTLPGGGFGNKSGTSMASPHAVGAAALLIAAGARDNLEVREVLAASAYDLGSSGWDTWYGFGLVDVATAVTLISDGGTAPAPEPEPEPEPTPESPAAPGVASVSQIAYSTYGGRLNDKHLTIAVKLVDGGGTAVPNATVAVAIALNGKVIASPQGTTGSNGVVTFSLSNARSGTYQTLVVNVAAGSLGWDGETPANSFAK